MSSITIHGYIQTSDAGFAPCYDNHIWTLACCKSDIRYRIGNKISLSETDTEHFVVCFSNKCEKIYSIARIKSAQTTEQYFSTKINPRADQVYYYNNGIWYSHRNNPHYDSKNNEWIQLDDTYTRDIKYPRIKTHPLNYTLESAKCDFVYYKTTSADDQCQRLLYEIEKILMDAPRSNPFIDLGTEFIDAFNHDKDTHKNEYPNNADFGGGKCSSCKSKNNTCDNSKCK